MISTYEKWSLFLSKKILIFGITFALCFYYLHNTVEEVENARLTLTLYSSVQSQPMIHCNMPLEPHHNSKFKTGAGIEKRTKNTWVMAQKLNMIWNSKRWVFWAQDMPFFFNMCNFSGLFDPKYTLLCTSNGIKYSSIHLIAYLVQKIWKFLKNLNFGDSQNL